MDGQLWITVMCCDISDDDHCFVMRPLLQVYMNAIIQVYTFAFHYSHFLYFSILQYCPLRAFTYKANFPIINAICCQLVHKLLFKICCYANEQSSTCLSCVSLSELEILNLAFHFDESLIYWQFVDDQLYIGLLRFSKIFGMSKYAEASDVCACTCPVFPQQICSNQAQSSHLLFRPIVGIDKLRFSCILQDLIAFFFVCFEPLHCVDGQTSTQRLREDNCISWLCVVGHNKLLILYNGNRASTHHRPLIVDSLPSSNLRTSLLGSICEALDHESGRDVFFEFGHVGGNPQNHQHFLYIGDAHRVEVGNCVAESNATEHVGRLNQWIEEIESGDQRIGGHFDGGDVGSLDAHRFRQFGQVGEQFVLGHFASSSFHLGEVGQDEIAPESMLHRIEPAHWRWLSICWE